MLKHGTNEKSTLTRIYDFDFQTPIFELFYKLVFYFLLEMRSKFISDEINIENLF